MCKIKLIHPVLDKFARTISDDGLIDDLEVFINTFNTSDLVYKLDNLEQSLKLTIDEGSLLILDENGDVLTEFDGEFTYSTSIPPLKPEDVPELEKDKNDIIAHESGIKTSTRSTDTGDIIANDLKTRTREDIMSQLSSEYVLINVPDSPDYYPTQFLPKELHTILLVVPKSVVTDSMTIEEIVASVPDFAKWDGKPFPISLEYNHNETSHANTAHGKRNHEQRINIRAAYNEIEPEVAKQAFIDEFLLIQDTKKLVKENNKYAVYNIEKISKGVAGEYNADKLPLSFNYLKTVQIQPGVRVLPTGEVSIDVIENIDNESFLTSINLYPRKFTEQQLDFIFDNFTKDGRFNAEMIPLLQFVLGNKPNREDFAIKFQNDTFTIKFKLENTTYYVNEDTQISPDTLKNLRQRFNTVIFKNYPLALANKFGSENVTIREASDYLLRFNNISQKLLDEYLVKFDLGSLDNHLLDYVLRDFYPITLPAKIRTQQGIQATYKNINKYAYLSKPTIKDLKVETLNTFENLVEEKFSDSNININYYTSLDDLHKAYQSDFGEFPPNVIKGHGVNWYKNGTIHIDNRESRPYIITEEKIHALVAEKLEQELKEDIESQELKNLRQVAKDIKLRTKNSPNKAIWDDIFNKPTEGEVLNELIARGTTYPELIKELKSSKFKADKNLFEVFVETIQDIVNKLLGIDNDYYSLLVYHNVRLLENNVIKLEDDLDIGALLSYSKVPADLLKSDIRDGLDYLFSLYIAHKNTEISFDTLGTKYSFQTKLKFKKWIQQSNLFPHDIDIEEWFNDPDSQFAFDTKSTEDVDLEDVETIDKDIDEKEQGLAYDAERGTAVRVQERLTNRLRQVFRLLPRVDYNKNKVRNPRTNIPELMPLNEVIQEVYGELNGIVAVENIHAKLKSLAAKKENGEYKNAMFGALYKYLNIEEEPYSDLAMSFYTLIQNTELKVLKAVLQDGNSNVYVESGENLPKILAKWNSNFKENYDDNFTDNLLNPEFKAEIVHLFTPVGKTNNSRKNPPSLQEAYNILKKLGIVLSANTLKEINNNKVLMKQLKDSLLLLPNNAGILKRFKDFGGKDTIDKANALFKNTQYYKILERLESTYSPYRRSIMTRNAKGDLVNVYTLPNTALLQRNILNEFRTKLADSEFTESELGEAVTRMLSNILDVKFPKFLRDKLLSGEIQLEIYNLEGYKRVDNASTSDLTNYDYINQQGIFWHKMQTFEFQRTETGSSAWGYRFTKDGNPYKTPYVYNLLQEKVSIDKALPMFKTLFEGEILKLRKLQAIKDKPFGNIGNIPTKKYKNLVATLAILKKQRDEGKTNLDNQISTIEKQLAQDLIPGNYQPFQLFGFLPLTTQAKLIKNSKEDLEVMWKGILPLVEQELKNTIILGRNALQDYDATLPKGLSINSLLINYKIHQSISSLLFYGDGNWFGKFFKRAKGVVSTGTGNPVDMDMYKSITPDLANVFGDFKGDIKIKVTAVNDRNDKFHDDNGTAHEFEKLEQGVIKSIDLFLEKQNIPDTLKDIVKKNLVKGISTYREEINTTDGQSWVTLDLVKTMLKSNDLWVTQGLDKLYEYEVTYMSALKNNRIDELSLLDGVILTELEEAEYSDIRDTRQLFIENQWNILLNQGKITQQEFEILNNKPKGNWQSEKWQYFGNIKEYTEYNPIVFLKSSFAPLAPSEVLGTPMEKVMFDLYKTNTQILTTKSAMKGAIAQSGAASLGDNFDDIYGREFNIYLPYLKEQLKSNHKVKKENLLATQFVKLLFSDTQDADKNWLSPKTEKLFKQYLSVLENIRKVEEQKLLEELNITNEDGKYIIHDKKAIKDVLITELKRRSKNEEITDKQIEFLKNLEEDINFDYTGMAQTLSEILAGFIKKRLVRIKLPGNALILKTSYGVDTLKFYEYDTDSNKVSLAETKIAMQGSFKSLLKRKDVRKLAKETYGETPTKEQLRISLNKLIAQGLIPKRAITIFGYRIPTSGINLMDAYQIKEFLPESAGNTIIVPMESVVKAGEDFDIDKKNFYFPSFNNKGELISKPKFYKNPELELELTLKTLKDFDKDFVASSKQSRTALNELIKEKQLNVSNIITLIERRKVLNEEINAKFPEQVKHDEALKASLKNASDKGAIFAALKAYRENYPEYKTLLNEQKKVVRELNNADNKEDFKNLIEELKSDRGNRDALTNSLQNYYELLDKKSDLINYHKNHIQSHTNDLIDVASQAITQPERFYALVTPVSTDYLEKVLSRTASPDTPPNHRNTNFETILKKRIEMVLAGQKLTGFSATDSVAIQLFLKQNLRIGTFYEVESKKKGKTISTKIPIEFPAEIFKTPPSVKGEVYDFNSLYTSDGILKSELFNQLVQATIDAATASILAPVNITKDTLSIYQYLAVVIGLPLHEVTQFINHPTILQKQSYLDKGFTNNDALVETLKAYNTKYVRWVADKSKPDWKYIRENKPSDVYHLYLFEEYKKQANEYLSIKQAINFDTSPDRTGLDAQARLNLIKELQTPTYFPKDVVNGVLKESVISSKFITDLTKDIYEAYTPIRANKDFIERVLLYESGRRTWNKSKKERYRRVVQNDFQEYLIKRYVKIDDKSFNQYFKEVSNSIWERMKKYEYLSANFNLNKIEDNIQHIHIFPSSRDDGSIEGINKDFDRIRQEDPKLLKDIIVTAIGLHGFNVAPYTWTSILPYEDVFNLIKDGVKNAESDLEINSKDIVKEFFKTFREQDDNIVLLSDSKIEYKNKPKYLDISIDTIEPTKVIETKEEVFDNSFSYNDITIGTDFPLGEEQQQALINLIDYVLSGNEDFWTLEGFAGTGKTSIIGYLEKYLDKVDNSYYTTVYGAPTHAATVQLAFSTVKHGNKNMPATLASSIRYNKNLKKWVLTKKIKDLIGFSPPLFVLDEASMTDDIDINALVEAVKGEGGKVIFMGDSAQINKVGNYNVSKAFDTANKSTLTKIYRQKDKKFVELLDAIRNNNKIEYVKNNNDTVKFLNTVDYNKYVVNAFKNNPTDTVYIAYRNNTVNKFNRNIRKALGKGDTLEKGDIIVGYLGYADKQIDKGHLANSLSYEVTDINKHKSGYTIDAYSEKLKELVDTGITGVSPRTSFTYLPLSTSNSFNLKVSGQDIANNISFLSDIFKKVHNANVALQQKKIKYETYLLTIAQATQDLPNIAVDNKIVYNPATETMEPFDSVKHKFLKTSGLGSLLLDKGVDYGYGITIHKAQGSTIKDVVFDLGDLQEAGRPTPIKDKDGNTVNTENNALYYVAMSRASNNLAVREEGLIEPLKTLPETTDLPVIKTDRELAKEAIKDRQDNPGTIQDKIANALQYEKITPTSFDRWVDKNLKKERLNFIRTKAKGGVNLDVIAQSLEVDEHDIADFILTYKSVTEYWNEQLEAYIDDTSIEEDLKGYKSYSELPQEETSSNLFNYAKTKLGSTLAAYVLNRGVNNREEIDELANLINTNSDYEIFRFKDGTSFPLFQSSLARILDKTKTMSIRQYRGFDGGIFDIQGAKIEVVKEAHINNVSELNMTQEEILKDSGITEAIKDEKFKRFLDGENQQRVVYKFKLLNNNLLNTSTSYNFKNSTLSKINLFLETAGVDIELVDKLIYGGQEVDALAASNFTKGTIQIINDAEKRPKAWNSLPEEAAHFWFRLLKSDSELKKALWDLINSEKNIAATGKVHPEVQKLLNSDYAKIYGEEDLALLEEEAIGKLIAAKIQELEEGTKDNFFLDLWKLFIKKVQAMLKDVNIKEEDPVEIAALKILHADMSELLSINEYKTLSSALDGGIYEAEVASDSSDYFGFLFNNKFRKQSKYLNKTITKLREKILSKVNITKELTAKEKKELQDINAYRNMSSTLMSLPLLLKKYKKNKLPLSSPIKLNGIKKKELDLLNTIRETIKAENPKLRSISSEDFINEVQVYLDENYILGFAFEKNWLDYNIKNTFVHYTFHNKISLRFNDEYIDRVSHFPKSPLAWGNLTPYAQFKAGDTDAVLIHEIQNDHFEFFKGKTTIVDDVLIDRASKNDMLFKKVLTVLLRYERSNPISDKIILQIYNAAVREYRELNNVKTLPSIINAQESRLDNLYSKRRLVKGYFTRLLSEEVSSDLLKNVHLYEDLERSRLTTAIKSTKGFKSRKFDGRQRQVIVYKELIKDIETSINTSKQIIYKNKAKLNRLSKLHNLKDNDAINIVRNIHDNYKLLKEQMENKGNISKNLMPEWATEYFTPLVHHLIQTAIRAGYGKDKPIVFSGAEITKLTQGKEAVATANIYAGKEEVEKGLAPKVGSLFTAMSKIKGIKLIYKENLPGFRPNLSADPNASRGIGGYIVDVSNYKFDKPLLFNLNDTSETTPTNLISPNQFNQIKNCK